MLFTLKREKPAKDKPKEDKPEADKQAIQGVWQVTDVEVKEQETSGQEDALKKIKTQQWVFTADKITVQTPGEKDDAGRCLHAGPVQKPKEIDPSPGGTGVHARPGIYSLEGDVLKLCFPAPEGGTAADGTGGRRSRQKHAPHL